MTCLMGNTEKRVIHHGFELLNLNSDAHDYTHEVYLKYLETNYFIVPGEQAYWAHMTNNMLPGTPSREKAKGLFNVFPLRLDSDDLHSKTSGGGSGDNGGSNMGEFFSYRRVNRKGGGFRFADVVRSSCSRAQVWCRLHRSRSSSNLSPSWTTPGTCATRSRRRTISRSREADTNKNVPCLR
jgi:hypothetical protein